MPRVSKEKKDKISEQILHFLFSISPDSRFTSDIAKEIARDEEFTKAILNNLKQKALLVEINKNKEGVSYSKRQRWRLSNPAFEVYKSRQPSSSAQQSLNSANFLE